jgi:hypothetical protein
MAQEGIATLPMQDMPAPQESSGIGAFQPQPTDVPEVGERERFDAVMVALEQQLPGVAAKVEQILDEANLTPEQVQGLEYVVNFLEQNKDNYPAAIQSLVAEGTIEEGDFPPQYNEEFMVLLKMVVYGYQAREMTPEPVPFAKGGLAQAAEALRQQGRGGDTILAHINPEEARLLKRMGGSGTINPNTGLPEFFVKSVFKAVSNVVGGAAKAVGGAVKSVVGAASKVLGPQLTSIVATVGGFMIGGPAGAALAQGLVTYGQGGSLKDVLLNSATAYIGGAYGPTAGAIAGGGATMLRGGSLKDAIKAAAISYGTSYAMGKMGELGSQGQAPVTDLSQTGSIDANGNFVPDAGVATPGSISATNPSGVGGPTIATPSSVTAANPSGTSGGFGLNAGPAPGSMSPGGTSQFGSLNYQAPTNYLAGAPSTGSAGISSLGSATSSASPGFFSNLASGNFAAAGSDALNFAKANPMTTAGLVLGATGAMGGFQSQPATPPNLVERTPGGAPATGEDYIARDPSKYIVQGMPGVGYDASGNLDPSGTPYQPNPAFQNAQTFATPQYGAPGQPTYPTYTPPMMAAAPVAGNPVPQPYNTMAMYNFLPSTQPRYMNEGGIASMFPPSTSVLQMNRGGYPRKTGQISGPGTETSDDIPAMLSDGEFVVTAKAVRGIGNGSRREGAKKLYRMMHAMEKKAGGKV